jgi:hypothetical protein
MTTGEWDTCKENLTHYNKEIRKAKKPSWRRYYQVIEDVPGSARLMKIMARQETHKVGSTKLPDGVHSQTASKALQELCRVHFPDCRPTDHLTDGQGHLNLGTCFCNYIVFLFS